MADLKELKQRIDYLNKELRDVGIRRRDAENEYALAVAETLGVFIGSIVTIARGRRYRVTRIDNRSFSNPPISLSGVLIRKDGSDGKECDIWQDWKLEAADVN
jgi:hypothetical protein